MPDWQTYYIAYLIGKSYVGIRTEDIMRSSRYLQSVTSANNKEVKLIAIGSASIPALHAAVLNPKLFKSVTVDESITSWGDVLKDPNAKRVLPNAVHGALEMYDLDTLRSMIGKEKLESK